jgi:hypothetical protein
MTEERSFHHSEDNFVGAKFLALPVDSVNTGFVKKLPSAHAELKIVTRRRPTGRAIQGPTSW